MAIVSIGGPGGPLIDDEAIPYEFQKPKVVQFDDEVKVFVPEESHFGRNRLALGVAALVLSISTTLFGGFLFYSGAMLAFGTVEINVAAYFGGGVLFVGGYGSLIGSVSYALEGKDE